MSIERIDVEVPESHDASPESLERWLESMRTALKNKLQVKTKVLIDEQEDTEEFVNGEGGFFNRYPR